MAGPPFAFLQVTQRSAKAGHDSLDHELSARLTELGFTGRIETTLEQRLGRHLDQRRANLGRLLWFDTIGGLNNDNTCGGCHSPTNAFGDTQSIAIGIDNNGIVGPHRVGPRNQRRTPMAINAKFFPKLKMEHRLILICSERRSPNSSSAWFLQTLRSINLLAGRRMLPQPSRRKMQFYPLARRDALRVTRFPDSRTRCSAISVSM